MGQARARRRPAGTRTAKQAPRRPGTAPALGLHAGTMSRHSSTFTVTLSAASDQPMTMSYRTTDSTAKSGEDDVAKTGTLTLAPGETTKTFTVEVKGDSKKEADETFYLDLFGFSSNALFNRNRGIGTILNDD
jgi:hypothetical protein